MVSGGGEFRVGGHEHAQPFRLARGELVDQVVKVVMVMGCCHDQEATVSGCLGRSLHGWPTARLPAELVAAWPWPGMASCLPPVAPQVAPRNVISRANLRTAEPAIDLVAPQPASQATRRLNARCRD